MAILGTQRLVRAANRRARNPAKVSCHCWGRDTQETDMKRGMYVVGVILLDEKRNSGLYPSYIATPKFHGLEITAFIWLVN
jgi:hypothetical protein